MPVRSRPRAQNPLVTLQAERRAKLRHHLPPGGFRRTITAASQARDVSVPVGAAFIPGLTPNGDREVVRTFDLVEFGANERVERAYIHDCAFHGAPLGYSFRKIIYPVYNSVCPIAHIVRNQLRKFAILPRSPTLH